VAAPTTVIQEKVSIAIDRPRLRRDCRATPIDGEIGGCLVRTAASDLFCRAISRSELFATLFLLAILNALGAELFPLVQSEGLGPALAQLPSKLSVVSVAAIVVGFHLLRQTPATPIKPADCLAAGAVALLLLVPHRAAAWLAVTGLALYVLVRDRRFTTAVASASVFLALAASNFWGMIILQVFSSVLLAWDAALAATLLNLVEHGGVDRIGNGIVTPDQTSLIVLLPCSFLPNFLHGCLLWTTVARAARPAWRPADLLALLAVGGLVLTANTLRLALLGLSADTYQWVHGSVGDDVLNIGLLLAIAAIALHSTSPAAPSLVRWRGAPRGHEPLS
jgi:hypothetical protein